MPLLCVWRQTGLTFGSRLFKAGRLWSESGLSVDVFAACVCVCVFACLFASVGQQGEAWSLLWEFSDFTVEYVCVCLSVSSLCRLMKPLWVTPTLSVRILYIYLCEDWYKLETKGRDFWNVRFELWRTDWGFRSGFRVHVRFMLGLMDLRVQMSYRALTKIEVHVCVLKGVGSDSCSSCLLWNIIVDELLCVAHYVHISLFPLSRHASSCFHNMLSVCVILCICVCYE